VQSTANPVPSMIWYCKGAIARHRNQVPLSQLYFHRYLRAVRTEPDTPGSARLLTRDDGIARAWAMLAITAYQRGRIRRSRWIAEQVLAHFGDRCLKRINGNVYLLLGKLAERSRDLDGAMQAYQKSHGEFLSEHNWYYHLHVLYGYARIARHRQQYPQAYWYLDLMEKATHGPGFASLQRELRAERSRLEQDAVDLLIDSQKGVVKTRDGGQINLRKQYVLLNILQALSGAHQVGEESGRGLSKAEIIEKVWNEQYRPEAHDNKLYYNINRLRKLLEPDMRQPQYLQNWREGYRLAPGLRVQLVGPASASRSKGAKE
jgi:DNA-binding winged helix-turn-helix (wHTH) protein